MGLTGPLPQVDDYYDAIAYNVLGTGMLFGPSFAGRNWVERVENEGDFTNWGVYFDMDYALTDSINILAGLRYSTDEKSFSWLTPGTNYRDIRPGMEEVIFSTADDYNVGQGVREAREEWSATTGRLVGQYHFSETAMAFLSYSTGYKSGGFDSSTCSPPIRRSSRRKWTISSWALRAILWKTCCGYRSATST
ncbi:TonB-dependent receptor domain-containing protein [Microbulbifer taiwanensis]|uniref:TonB-dependent receptor domain-containing protein n=1 Tax=Microbulbifer taiwanensis TaxID=986746 RepID=UPI00361E95B0